MTMKRTMAFALIGATLVTVHTVEMPLPTEYDAWVAFARKHARTITGVVVYTLGGAPGSLQRSRTATMWKEARGGPPVVVVVMPNIAPLVRGVITALTWIMGEKVTPFDAQDLHEALVFARVPLEMRYPVRSSIEALASQLASGGPS